MNDTSRKIKIRAKEKQMNKLATTKKELVLTEQRPLDQNPALVYLAGLGSPHSLRSQKHALTVIANILGADILSVNWGALRFQHVQAIRSKLIERYKPATVNRSLSALRGTLKSAFLLDQMAGEDYTKAVMVKAAVGEVIPAGREIETGELLALFQVCEADKSPAGARDAAIFGLLYSCGLRRAEVASLEFGDYNSETGALKVRGKRSKERIVYVFNGAAAALNDWLSVRGDSEGALFFPINKAGKITARRLTTQAIYNLLQKRLEQAKVKSCTVHDFRRTFVSDLLDAGADISIVAKMAGHASVNTTARYDRRPEQAKAKAANLLHVPYASR